MGDFFEDLGKKITETAEVLGKKTEEVVEVQKIRNQIRTMERSNERDIKELGKMVFAKYQEKTAEAEYEEVCADIQKREEDIKAFNKKIAALKGTDICGQCHRQVDEDMIYCPYCGTLVEREAKTEAAMDAEVVAEEMDDVVSEAAEDAEEVKEEVNESGE